MRGARARLPARSARGRRSRTTRRRSARCPSALVARHADRRLPARSRPAAPTRSTSCARSAGSARPSRTPRPPTRCSCTRSLAAQRPQIAERGLEGLLHDVELPLVRVLRGMEVAGVHLDTTRLAEIRTRVAEEAAAFEREIWELCGTEFMIGSPQQLAEVLFVKLGLSKKRRGKTGFSTDARVLQSIRHEHRGDPEDRALARADEARLDLPRRAAGADRRRRPPPHDVQPGDRGDRPALLDQPEPAEHPDPHAARPRDPRLLRRRARQPADLGRLLAGRAADPRPHRRRGGPEGHLPSRRGRPYRDRGGDPARAAGPARRRLALEGEDGQLRDRLRALGLRPRRPLADPARGGAGVHRSLPRRLPSGAGVHRLDDRAGHGEWVRDDAARAAAA